MSIKAIEAYETTDGKVFSNSKDAEKHQAALDFIAWYQSDNEVPGGPYEGCKVNATDLLSWLYDHKDMLSKILRLKS